MQTFLQFVEDYLIVNGTKCYRHCEQPTRFVQVSKVESSVVGAYICPDNYVSRVVYFSDNPDEDWFRTFLVEQLGDSWVRPRDIRVATRHGWELGGNAEEDILLVSDGGYIREFYWTFYPKSDTDRATGTFLCENCNRMFRSKISDKRKLCVDCAKQVKL